MKIKVLSEDTINKIAAGEVIERPASIVKELIENSLDAGAGKIYIEVKAGGKNLIRVSDDGIGMDKDDAVLAFNRHATSKINSADDLNNLKTLGFRGEALPSIASVSKVLLVTKSHIRDYAVQVRIEGGKIIEVKETGAPSGTMINVQNLFYNTPARRKFLKANTTEFGHILNTVSNYCLIYENCGFNLIHNGENILEIFPKDSLPDRIRILYGNEIAEEVMEVSYEKNGIKITGFAGKPVLTRNNRLMQFLFVNKRPIVNRPLGFAVNDTYRGLIPNGKFPIVFLFLEIPTDTIDVNVHPTKKEVKFSDDRIVQEIVKEAIMSSLGVKEMVLAVSKGKTGINDITYRPHYGSLDSWSVQEVSPSLFTSGSNKVIQMNDSYIINESEDGFEIIDQHAVHERILYEKIKTSLEKKTPESQRLLIPINVELSVEEERILKENFGFLRELGFEIEEFGNRTVIIDGIPAIMEKVNITEFIKDFTGEIKEFEKCHARKDIKDDIIKIVACKSSVKQGDKLDSLEMQKLVKEWKGLNLPYTCPHGRPAVIKMTKEELDRKFKRS